LTAHVLISGTLYRSPEQKTAKSGKPYVAATIRCKNGEASQWWKVLCFSESGCAELMRLGDGDAVSAQGALKVETYDRDGAVKLSLTCMADAVLPLRAAPKQRKVKESTEPQRAAPADRGLSRHAGNGEDYFRDEMPF
jgi:hypothetical protein